MWERSKRVAVWQRNCARISTWRARSVHPLVPSAHAQHGLKGPLQIWNFYAYAEHTPKKLMCMLGVRISSWPLCSGYASVPYQYAQGTHHILMRMLSMFWRDCALCTHYSSWRVCSVPAPVPDSYAQRTHQFLMCMLSIRISSWRACSVHASVPFGHAEGIQNEDLKNGKTDAHAEHACKELMHRSGCAHAQCTHQFLTRMLRVCIKVGACT